MLMKIEKLIEEKNHEELILVAHALKGAVANFFVRPSTIRAKQLEEVGKSGTVEGSEKIFKGLKKKLKKLQNTLLEATEKRDIA